MLANGIPAAGILYPRAPALPPKQLKQQMRVQASESRLAASLIRNASARGHGDRGLDSDVIQSGQNVSAAPRNKMKGIASTGRILSSFERESFA